MVRIDTVVPFAGFLLPLTYRLQLSTLRAKPKGVGAWERKYQELQEYREAKGDSNVPTKYKENRALGRWVSTQRNMYKRFTAGEPFNNLSLDEIERRIALLKKMDFCWVMLQSSGSDESDGKAAQVPVEASASEAREVTEDETNEPAPDGNHESGTDDDDEDGNDLKNCASAEI